MSGISETAHTDYEMARRVFRAAVPVQRKGESECRERKRDGEKKRAGISKLILRFLEECR